MDGPRSTPTAVAETIAEWKRWVEVLRVEAMSLVHYRRIFREIMEMIQSNPELPESSPMYLWLKNVYGTAAIAAVRRLADDHPGGASLYRLIGELRGAPRVITRSWFLAQHKDLPAVKADRNFNDFATAADEFIDPKVLKLDQMRVKVAARTVTNFADKYVAHRDERIALKKTLERMDLTWGELDTAIDTIVRILRKCELLLLQLDYGDHVPTPQEDWKAVFRVPWLKEH